MSTPQAPNTEQFKEQVRHQYTDAAMGWRKWNHQFVVMSRAATDTIVEAARVKPGMRVLDLASGTGEPAHTLAEVVGSTGQVTATDLVPEMLAVAEEFARERRLANIIFQQADAEALPFPDQTFDVVTCRFGVMFFPNVRQALQEIYRVLKMGGRAAFVAWGPLDQNPYEMSIIGVLKKYMNTSPDLGAPSPFKFGQAGTLFAALQGAGFQQVQEEYRTIPWPWPGPVKEFWESTIEIRPRLRPLIQRLAPEQREQVDAEVIEAIRQYYDGQQVNFTAVIVVASGVR